MINYIVENCFDTLKIALLDNYLRFYVCLESLPTFPIFFIRYLPFHMCMRHLRKYSTIFYRQQGTPFFRDFEAYAL